MGHYVKVIDGIVTQVIVADQDFIDNHADNSLGEWIKTSYNTRCGKHICPKTGKKNTKTPLRKNFAGIGYKYDKDRDAFIPPQKFASWILNEDKCIYEAPQPTPDDGKTYVWDEREYYKNNNGWVEITDE